VKQRDKIKAIIANAKDFKQIIQWRSELAAMNKKNRGENWIYRSRFVINYFQSRNIDVLTPNTEWNKSTEDALQLAFILFNNKGQQIQDDNILPMSHYDYQEADDTWENSLADDSENDLSLEDDEN